MKTIDETKGLLEMKAGALARVFSQLDPNTPVYNNGEGRFIINASNNDIEKLARAFEESRMVKGKPSVLIANTIKGKGSSVMENKAAWHHHVPSAEEYEQIKKDLAARALED